MESLVQAWFENQSHPSHHRLVCYFKCAPEVNYDDKEYLEHVYMCTARIQSRFLLTHRLAHPL